MRFRYETVRTCAVAEYIAKCRQDWQEVEKADAEDEFKKKKQQRTIEQNWRSNYG